MGSGISTKYEKTYFYSKGTYTNQYEEKEESKEDWLVSEDSPKYNAGTDTHTIEYYNDEKVKKYCEDMVKREPKLESNYTSNAKKTTQYYETNKKGFFGKRSTGEKVWTIESDNPMETAMDFYSRISEGGRTGYLGNHHGITSSLGDKTRITFRPYPKTEGSPSVEIKLTYENLRQKIHFIKR
jgi:hypothetical protein